ncbi:response regulator [Telmatospirillum sp.]|uniref:response regulator n=1 Tax=Telmatospirillum sp. TaxID=2079197 RepID=UPI00284BE474|nr:response regulator [Telmatospirillum sp.]MDR3436679.1 response regulator [Telmatospirillum sp.]
MTEKIRILFVDDEPHVLNGLRRAISAVSRDWEMTFCGSGEEAIARMAQMPFDVVVTDMRMPEIDGAQLLEIVRTNYPATVRIILSGYADTTTILRTIGPAHAYLAKPCDSRALAEAIARPLALRRMMTSAGMHRAIGGLVNLPSLPSLFLEIEAELRSPNSSIRAVADIINRDVAMTAEILKLTNSAFFSVGSKISTTLQAVRTLGLETVQALVLRIGLFRQFSGNNPNTLAMITALTDHSMTIARLAEAIAISEGADSLTAKAASCAGMLCYVGMIILLDSQSDDYRKVLARVTTETPLDQLEQETFGANHALIGAYLLGLWGFSEPIVEAIALSCHPRRTTHQENILLTALHAARALGPPIPWLPPGYRDVPALDRIYLEACRGNSPTTAWEILATTPHDEVRR